MTPEQFDTLLEHIESGDTLKASIKAAKTSWRALTLYLESGGEGPSSPASRYARARVTSGDFYADKAQEAVEQAVSPQDAALARVKADVYKWRAAMANPTYRDRQVNENTGTVTIKVVRDAGIAATARIESAYGAERALPAAYDTEAVEADPG